MVINFGNGYKVIRLVCVWMVERSFYGGGFGFEFWRRKEKTGEILKSKWGKFDFRMYGGLVWKLGYLEIGVYI